MVTEAGTALVKAVLADGEAVEIAGDGLKFASRSLGDKAAAATRIRPGAVIRLTRDAKGRWEITQLPQAESAFVSVRPSDGAVLSLVGGFDFNQNKFNHVTQAQRQPGSAFKPFIYSAALEKGFTPATIVNDAPFFVPATKPAARTGQELRWQVRRPDAHRARCCPVENLVTVRVLVYRPGLRAGIASGVRFRPVLHPAYLTMGLARARSRSRW